MSVILPAVVQTKKKQPRVSISMVGPGNLGTALALALTEAGYTVRAIMSRPQSRNVREAKALARRVKAQHVVLGKDALDSELVWIAVPDDAIASVAEGLAAGQEWKGKTVFHSSGALSSDELQALRERGAKVASVHPMMTFVRSAVPVMHGVSFAIEGDAAAVRLAKRIAAGLGGNSFEIEKRNKVLYHAFGSFASPLVIALMAAMEQVAEAAGIAKDDAKEIMVPLLRQTLRNYLKHDAARAFSGPLIRGDVATVRKHLEELKRVPEAREVYVALAKLALQRLPVGERERMKQWLMESG